MLSLADKMRDAGLATAEQVVQAEQLKKQIRQVEVDLQVAQRAGDKEKEQELRELLDRLAHTQVLR